MTEENIISAGQRAPSQTHLQYAHWVVLVAVLTLPLSGMTVDIYVPSLPAIVRYFAVPSTLVKLSISVYMFGYAMFQIVFGPLSDAWGRRGLLLFGASFYALAALAVTFSPNIHVFLFLRFVQGVAVACIASVARAIVPDTFTGKAYKIVTNYTTIAWAVGPIIAPFIGGYLQYYIGWRAPFYFLFGYGVMLLLLIGFLLPETNTNPRPWRMRQLMADCKTMLSSRQFVAYVLMAGLIYSMIIIFNVLGPFLVQDVLGFNAIVYGHLALCLGAAWFIGNTMNRFFIESNLHRRLRIALVVALLSPAVVLCFISQGSFNLWTLGLSTFVLFVAGGVIYPNVYGGGLRLFTHMSGTTSALLGSLLVAMPAVVGVIASYLKTRNQIDLAVSYLVIAMLLAGIYWLRLRDVDEPS
jgi:Bcr/CflA subfamily drug resistance transporter